MDSNPICHPSPAKKMKCSFLDYVQLLMIRRAGWSTRTPSATPLQPKKWNAGRWTWALVPFCRQKNCSFLDYIQLLMIGQLVHGLEPHLPPLSSQKNEMLIFGLRSTSDDQEGWLIDSNPICHPSPAKKMKCSFLDYVQLLMIRRAGWSTQTPSATPLQRQKWNAHFWITFNFWWSAGLVNGLKPHLPPLSSQKHEMLVLDYIQLLMIGQAGRCTRTPFATSLQPQKWNAHFWITFNSWWLAGLVDGHEPCVWPLCSQKTEMLIFGLCSTSDDWLGWLMDSNLICHPSPAKRMKCLFLDYLQLLMIGQAGQWTRTPSTTSLQPKKWNAHFWITFNFWWLAGLVDGLEPCVWPLCSQKNEMLIFGLRSTSDDWPGWSMDSNPICHPSPAKKIKCSF